MALSKQVELPDGVVVGYHRVVRVDIHTNAANYIELRSYTTAAARERERAAVGGGYQDDVYYHTSLLQAGYDQGMDVSGAYAWVKENVDELEGAEDA